MSNYAEVQKKLFCLKVYAILQLTLKSQSLTTNIVFKRLNINAKYDYRYFIYFDSSKNIYKARIHDFWLIISYFHARLYTRIIYSVKIYCDHISAMIDKVTNMVYKSTKKKIIANNKGFKISKICSLSKLDERKR